MDIGLYKMKYPARRLIGGVLPWMRHVNPNIVSWLILPVGVAIAVSYYFGARGRPVLYIIAFLLIFVRMYLGTLDGLMAEHFNKQTPTGEIMNRLVPEIADILYLLALTAARPEWLGIGLIAVGIAWLTSFAGLVGLLVNKPVQSAGPAGQTDRLAALLVLTLAAYLSEYFEWDIDFIKLFLIWTALGGALTVMLRLGRNLQRIPEHE